MNLFGNLFGVSRGYTGKRRYNPGKHRVGTASNRRENSGNPRARFGGISTAAEANNNRFRARARLWW